MEATSKFLYGKSISIIHTVSLFVVIAMITIAILPVSRAYASDFSDDFADVSSSSWTRVNLSTLIGLTTWHQGVSAVFHSQAGANNAYAASDAGSAVALGVISNWFISPEFPTISNGDTINFYTRTTTTVTSPDRLQVRLSTNGSCNPGLTEVSVNDFSTLILDINPTLTTSGYPRVWTQYSVTVTGLSGNVSGCFAFRHFVTNAGLLGTNGSYIGIDSFNYVDVGLPTATPTATVVPPRPDTIGVYKNGTFYLRNTNNEGISDITVSYGGDDSDLPVTGDWNGDGIDTIGVYRSSTGFFFLSDSNTSPALDYNPIFGNPGDTPFAGKWTADMTHDGIGVYRDSNGILYQRKALTGGFDDFFAIYGNPGDKGFAGDWDGNGYDGIGIYRPSIFTWYLSNNSEPSGITYSDVDFIWDIATNLPVVGDWDGNNASRPAYLTATGVFTLHSANSESGTDNIFAFGPSDSKPIAGKWVAASRPPSLSSVIGIHAPSSNQSDSGSAD